MKETEKEMAERIAGHAAKHCAWCGCDGACKCSCHQSEDTRYRTLVEGVKRLEVEMKTFSPLEQERCHWKAMARRIRTLLPSEGDDE